MDNDLELKRNYISILSNIRFGEIILFKNRTVIVYNCATKSNKEILKIKCSKTPKRVSVIGFLLPKNFIDKESLV